MNKKNQKTKVKKAKALQLMQREVYYKVLDEDLEYLKKIGPPLFEMKFTDFRWNILHLAVWNDKIKLIHFILSESQGKTLINEKDINEETPLHIASFIKNEKCFDILIKNGASVDEKNICQEKPIQLVNLEEKTPFTDYLKANSYTNGRTNNHEILKSRSLNKEKKNSISLMHFNLEGSSEIPVEITTIDRKRIDMLFGKNLNQNSFVFFSKHKKYCDQDYY